MRAGRCALVLCVARAAAAQPAPDGHDPWNAPIVPASGSSTAPAPAAAPAPDASGDFVKLGGYLEVYDAWNFNEPSNGITNLRFFDDRHASIALQNAVIDATWKKGPLTGRIALQVGDAGDTYYLLEPSQPAAGSAPATSSSEWRHVQEAWVAWQAVAKLELSAGLFFSPLGPESVPTKDNWNWSRSDLFFALPPFHVGARGKYAISEHWSAIGAVYNGWSNAIDQTGDPSIDLIALYANGAWTAQAQYFGGVQRVAGSPEGQPWRHLFDAFLQGPVVGKLAFIVQGDAGFEDGSRGRAGWAGVAGYLKYDLTPHVYVAARGDWFREWRPPGAEPISLPIGTEWIASGTATVSWRPVTGLDLRAEFRHDQASDEAYYGGTVLSDPISGAAIANRRAQNTVTGGVIAWF